MIFSELDTHPTYPLSTLRGLPHDRARARLEAEVARLGLPRKALSSSTSCRFIPAHQYPNYYTLHVPPPPVQEGVHASLAVREFRSPTYLHQGAIVYKTSPEQIGFYNYHRWAVDPREFVTNAVTERLRAIGNFTQVKLYDGRSDVDYVLSGRLEKLEEVDYDGGVRVEVAISAQMINLSNGAAIWTNEVSEVGTVGQRDVPAVVSEMNRTMEKAIEKLLTPPPPPCRKGN